MYPPEPRTSTTSRAEIRYFGIIRRELSDEWIALHSLGLSVHPAKPWAEIDFVLIGPTGIYCLEIKGGRVELKDGIWRFIDGDGNVAVRSEGPFEQVGPAAASLYNHLINNNARFAGIRVGYGVVTPDIVWKITGPAYESDVVYDERDRQRSFRQYVERISAYWHDRLQSQKGKPPRDLSDRDRAEVLHMLRGDFDLRPSLRTRIDYAKEELLALTEEQYLILDSLSDNQRVLISGGAGTGKTLLAVEEARRQAGLGRRVLLLCFNSNLANFLSRIVTDVPGVRTVNLHRLMHAVIKEAGLTDQLSGVCDEDLYEVFYPDLCLEGLPSSKEYEAYDSLIIDEGQDILRGNYIEVLDSLLKGGIEKGNWAVFLDPFQNLYGGLTSDGIGMLNKGNPARFNLSINCRNTAPVAITTQMLSGINWAKTQKTSGPDVEFYWYRDFNDQRGQLKDCLNRVLSNRISPGSIVILSRYRMGKSAVCDEVTGIPYRIAELMNADHPDSKAITFSTIGSFKGLEADCVILLDVDDLTADLSRLLLYEACSRAIAFLAVFVKDQLQSEYEKLAFDFGRRLRRIESYEER